MFESKKNNLVLVVAAHADDEALGCGGTIARHVSQGDQVHVVFMADGVGSRPQKNTKETEQRVLLGKSACKLLGTQEPIFLDLPDNKMDSIPFLDIVQALERVILQLNPYTVYTHFNNDLNIDHRLTHQAVMTACRPTPNSSVKEIYCFEVLSSTEWSAQGRPFQPNHFVNIEKYLDTKLAALNIYQHEMREFPHSRSIQNVKNLAGLRGASVGLSAAEAFVLERKIT